MNQRGALGTLGLIAALGPGIAAACSCATVEYLLRTPTALARDVARVDLVIVHARVAEIVDESRARLTIIESLRGRANPEVKVVDSRRLCGTHLNANDEHVFFVYDGWVNHCSKYEPIPAFIDALRRTK